jgi:hypothetical protein
MMVAMDPDGTNWRHKRTFDAVAGLNESRN